MTTIYRNGIRIFALGLLTVVGLAALPIEAAKAGKEERKAAKAAQRESMSGVVSSIEKSGGMVTLRLDNGESFTASEQKVTVRDFRRSVSSSVRKATPESGGAQPRFVEASLDDVAAGSRVVMRQKLGKDGTLKRFVIRIVEE